MCGGSRSPQTALFPLAIKNFPDYRGVGEPILEGASPGGDHPGDH